MQSALAAQGVRSEVVEDAALTELPAPRQLIKAEFTPAGLGIYDLMGRSNVLAWKDILAVAAERVRLTEFKYVRELQPRVYLSESNGVLSGDHLALVDGHVGPHTAISRLYGAITATGQKRLSGPRIGFCRVSWFELGAAQAAELLWLAD